MVDITLDNYEAFFLDFAEGNLSEAERHAVLQFVEYHPELKDELEEFEIISVADADTPSADWSNLKKTEVDAKEALYFKAVENDLSDAEKSTLDSLLTEEENQRDFKAWQLTKIKSQGESISKSEIYQLGLELPIGAHNYEHFLIALGEGLLNPSQVELLKAYAGTQADGERDLKLASALQLKPAKGIFYPDKKALYKKEKRVAIWWYRAAAIAVLLTLGAFLFNTINQDPGETQVAEQPKIETSSQNNAAENFDVESEEETLLESDTIAPVKSVVPKAVQEPVFQENVAQHSPEPVNKTSPVQLDKKEDKEQLPITIDNPAPLEILAAQPLDTVPVRAERTPVEPMPVSTENIAQVNPSNTGSGVTFKTLPQLAEDAIASRFEIKDEERDEMAIVLAKRVTNKASEVLDSELRMETSDNGDNMTYTFRFRNFKVQHTRNL